MNLVLAGMSPGRVGWPHAAHRPAPAGRQSPDEIMTVAALAAWLLTAGLGLYMFAIWLIEDDGSEERKSYRRLRAPVVFGHAGFAVTGLAVWLVYMYVNLNRLACITILILLLVAILGAFMFTRWIPVHRMATRSRG